VYGGGLLTPTIDRLAASGVRFAHAFTTAPLTLPAHASILTGLLPRRHGIPNNTTFPPDQRSPTLRTLLAPAGSPRAALAGARAPWAAGSCSTAGLASIAGSPSTTIICRTATAPRFTTPNAAPPTSSASPAIGFSVHNPISNQQPILNQPILNQQPISNQPILNQQSISNHQSAITNS